jgi:D-3-phosphoglycerate dehydrogenase
VGPSRLLHIHKNQPGILTQINQAFAENSINIAAQYLQTDDKVGYVVIEIETSDSQLALKTLKAIKGTIRARIIH